MRSAVLSELYAQQVFEGEGLVGDAALELFDRAEMDYELARELWWRWSGRVVPA